MNENNGYQSKKMIIRDYQIVIFVLFILLISYIGIFLIDIHNFLGIRDWMVANEQLSIPFLWDYLFTEGGPVEILQWLFIGLFVMTSSYIAGNLRGSGNRKITIFWTLLSLTGILMIMEDAGNVRHFLVDKVVYLFLEQEMTYRIITELIYFTLLGLIPLVALLKYGKFLLKNPRIAALLLIGYFFYGLAVSMSGTRDIMYWYQTAGDVLYNLSIALGGGEDLLMLYEETDQYLSEIRCLELRYRMMDYLVEESLELLGVGFLWASSLSYLEHGKTGNGKS